MTAAASIAGNHASALSTRAALRIAGCSGLIFAADRYFAAQRFQPRSDAAEAAVGFLCAASIIALLVALPGKWWRAAGLAAVFAAHYAEYANHHFTGAFITPDELMLARANSAREFAAAAILYLWLPAIAFVLLLAPVYLYLLAQFPPRRSVRRALIALGILGAVALEAAYIDHRHTDVDSQFSLVALAATNVHLGLEPLREFRYAVPARSPAPAPTKNTPAFDVIYVLGESIRADHLSAMGYTRRTSPHLDSLLRVLPSVAFNNVISDGDCTNRSVPLLMAEPTSPLKYDAARRPTIFAYAKRAGFITAFVSAQPGTVNTFVDSLLDTVDTYDGRRRRGEPVFADDEQLLPVARRLLHGSRKTFLVIQPYAAHWPYVERYRESPHARRFVPDLPTSASAFDDQHRAAIVNSYDNALTYFDDFLDSLAHLATRPALFIITSDHAESLGDDGRWGHCSASAQQLRVPLIFIATDSSVAKAVQFANLAARASLPVSQANLLPTLLDVFGFDATRLQYSYQKSLARLDKSDNAERRALLTAVDNGADPEIFAVLDRQGRITRTDTIANRARLLPYR